MDCNRKCIGCENMEACAKAAIEVLNIAGKKYKETVRRREMGGDQMPKAQYEFINKIKNYMLDASNMKEEEAWDFGFRVWQFHEYLAGVIGAYVVEERKHGIEVGDEVRYRNIVGDPMVITRMDQDLVDGGWSFDAIYGNGIVHRDGTLDLVEKTGRHYEVNEWLEKIRMREK